MIDAHCHVKDREFVRLLAAQKIAAIACGTDPTDAARTLRLAAGCPTVQYSFGLHPWKAGSCRLAEMLPFINRCRILGEIGLDSVWCNVPLSIQEQVFVTQLELACRRRMPVILHTKGQEQHILKLISQYPNRYLVHWYSGPTDIGRYAALGCYFTLGPCAEPNDPVLRHAPKNRILVESDGIDAISWAAGVAGGVNYLAVLQRSVRLIERRWALRPGEGEALVHTNFISFLNGKNR